MTMAAITSQNGIAGVTIRSFALTLLGVLGLGTFLAAASAFLLRTYPVYALFAATVALAEAFAVGLRLASKRALVELLTKLAQTYRPGQVAVRALFDRLALSRSGEQLTVVEADRRLDAPENAGHDFSNWLVDRLLILVKTPVLQSLRDQATQVGEVDLNKLQAGLEAAIDGVLISKFRCAVSVWTLLTYVGLPVLVFAQTCLLLALLNSR